MIEEVKLMLGDAAANYSDAQIGLAVKMAMAEVQGYCNRELESLGMSHIAKTVPSSMESMYFATAPDFILSPNIYFLYM